MAARGISLGQLHTVAAEITRRCEAENWQGGIMQANGSMETRKLTPETVNLYHLNELFLKPLTKATSERASLSYVELVATGAQRPVWFVSHWWYPLL